jgi:anti-anti-sigma regulatory factor
MPMNGNKEPQMTTPNFQHVRLSMVGDVALVEIRTRDLQGPKAGKELGSELAMVLAQDWARRILLDFHRTAFLSSSGFAALFKMVNQAKAAGREVKFCAMVPGVLVGAEVVGLPKVVEIHKDQAGALKSFAQA